MVLETGNYVINTQQCIKPGVKPIRKSLKLLSLHFKIQFMTSTLLLSMPGGTEMILIVIVVLLMFGGKKIPELMRGFGKGMREFKDAKNNVTTEFEKGMEEKIPEITKSTV